MIYNKEFLRQLDLNPHKITYVKITSLDRNDFPRESIEGQCTGGFINVDGASALRRSCQLTIVAKRDEPITNSYWAFERKFKLEIGLQNNINKNYPDIIWFPQGIYVITSFSKTENANGQIQISLSGQDKMCLLNGTLGGALPHEVDFGTEEIREGETTHIIKVPIYKIIKNAVQVYGQERLENIIINDLDEHGWELWEYRGEKPMYMFYKIPTENEIYGQVINMTFNGDTIVKIIGETTPVLISDETKIKYYSMNILDSNYNEGATQILFKEKENENVYCNIIKIESGETAGYHRTSLVYNDDLIAKAGESLTSVLDKIKNMLGDFEYFYDLNGRFIFQKKKTYIQELFSPINGEIVEPTMIVSPYSYKFENENLFTNISIPPKIDNVKNDFAIWGQRNGSGNAKIPIHVRYAIDTKPTEYVSPYQEKVYSISDYDWRELIYQMAVDYYQHGDEDKFLYKVATANKTWALDGITGYEQYYSDIQGFWRQLYNPNPTDDNYYLDGDDKYWTKKIHTDPYSLNFWFDFLDIGEGAELSKYSVKKIGQRSKVDNQSSINSIYNKETPEVQFIVLPSSQEQSGQMTYSPIWIQDNMKNLFIRSAQGQSCIERANELIFNHSCCNESFSISAIPIYYLEPNTRIQILNEDYTLDKISYNLNYNGTMTISGTKIIKQFY